MTKTLAVIFVEYDKKRFKGSFGQLLNCLKTLQEWKVLYYIIDNENEGDYTYKIEENIFLAGGNNVDREFSGWQKGIDMLQKDNINYQLALLVNSSFNVYGKNYLHYYTSDALFDKAYFQNTAIGRIDNHGVNLNVNGYNTSEWICTNAIVIPKTGLQKIGNIVTITEDLLEKYIEPTPKANSIIDLPARDIHFKITERNKNSQLNISQTLYQYFKPNAPICQEYQHQIIDWLSNHWHSKFNIDENYELFRAKVKGILNEALLTARLLEQNIKIEKYGDKKFY